MQMIQMAGRVLPRPVQVWVLDTVPGDAWLRDGGDHPRDTIEFVRTLPVPFDSRKSLGTSPWTELGSCGAAVCYCDLESLCPLLMSRV